MCAFRPWWHWLPCTCERTTQLASIIERTSIAQRRVVHDVVVYSSVVFSGAPLPRH